MRSKALILFLVLLAVSALVYGLSGQSHEFTAGQCNHCHIDEKNAPLNFAPTVSRACKACHLRLEQKKSHPTEVLPTMSIPGDMPLVEGRLTCITCHFAHPKENFQFFSKQHYYLRRQVKGVFFCTECHEIDSKGHIVFANIHEGSYVVTDTTTRIDQMSLECIQCHDTHIKSVDSSLGAGTWNHVRQEFDHPIGVSYDQIQMRKMRAFKPRSTMNKEMRFFNEKIGCGTCHNIYSKNKKMLALGTKDGNLCVQCHNK
jgi:predicted CXXCH cytochrome family protein